MFSFYNTLLPIHSKKMYRCQMRIRKKIIILHLQFKTQDATLLKKSLHRVSLILKVLNYILLLTCLFFPQGSWHFGTAAYDACVNVAQRRVPKQGTLFSFHAHSSNFYLMGLINRIFLGFFFFSWSTAFSFSLQCFDISPVTCDSESVFACRFFNSCTYTFFYFFLFKVFGMTSIPLPTTATSTFQTFKNQFHF